MKKTAACLIVISILLAFTACVGSVSNSTTQNNQNSNKISLNNKYKGYYATNEDGIVTVTNYDPDDIVSIPIYQEMVKYGDGAGMDNDGVVYSVYIIDTEKSNKGEKYYYTELTDNTLQVLVEEDYMFDNESDRQATVNNLLEIVNYAKDLNNE